MTTLKQASVETYIHEFRSLPHPGDFGIPKGHWWQAKAYAYHHADQLGAFTPAPQAVMEQQPVAWISKQSLAEVKDFDATVYGRGGFEDATPLYTELAKREWVGLTEEEAADCWSTSAVKSWKNIEAALKTKNT